MFKAKVTATEGDDTIISIYDGEDLAGILRIRTDHIGEFFNLIVGKLSIEQSFGDIEKGASVIGVKIDKLD